MRKWNIIILFLLQSLCLFPQRQYEELPALIAHGGGEKKGTSTSNAVEMIRQSLNKYKYIEIDLGLTSDSVVVGLHDWVYFNQLAGHPEWGDSVLSLRDFENCKISGKFTPTTYLHIQNFLKDYPDWILVTDKLDDAELLERYFGAYKDRMLVEAFSMEAYNELRARGFLPMLSDGDVSKLLELSVENMIEGRGPVEFTTTYFDTDYELIRRVKCLLPFRTAAYTVNIQSFVDEHLGEEFDLIYTDELKP